MKKMKPVSIDVKDAPARRFTVFYRDNHELVDPNLQSKVITVIPFFNLYQKIYEEERDAYRL